jgi:hypothetical protein
MVKSKATAVELIRSDPVPHDRCSHTYVVIVNSFRQSAVRLERIEPSYDTCLTIVRDNILLK